MTGRFEVRSGIVSPLAWLIFAIFAAQVPADDGVTIGPDDGAAAGSPAPPAEPSPDAKKYDMRYKLATGDVLRYDVKHRASIRSTIDDTTQAAQTKTDSIKVWKVTDVLPSGEIEFMNVVERVAMINQLPDRDAVEYDSDLDKTPPPGFEDAARAIGVPLSVVRMTPQGEIVRRDVKLRHLNAEDDAPIALRLPDKPVAIGETWDQPFEIRVQAQGGATKPIKTRRHHKLKSVTDNIATIEVAYQVLSPVDATTEAQLIERLMSGDVQFDMREGRTVGQQMEIDKRILGFAGPTSSMQYVMRMEEKLIDKQSAVAERKPGKPAGGEARSTANAAPSSESGNRPTNAATTKQQGSSTKNTSASSRRPTRQNRSAGRTTNPAGTKGYRR